MNNPDVDRQGQSSMLPSVQREQRVDEAMADLGLEDKVALTTGADSWSTVPVPGMGAIVFSDGPCGVRGTAFDERHVSVSFPSASALAAAWDPVLAERYGAALGVQARERGVDVVLGPMVTLHRSPLGGRHFETYSEDPVLTRAITAAYVRGLQGEGVGACVKHYAANDSETDRFTMSVEVDERSLRELHLAGFEAAVEAGAWAVMSGYNSVNGVTMTEHDLLTTPLCDEWGFDGVVVSDWGAVRSLASASARQDLVMPGPDGPWGDDLCAAVRDGRVPLDVLDEKVRRLLRLGARVGALGRTGAPSSASAGEPAQARALAREVATAGSVLLRNGGVLPLATDLTRVAVIGEPMLTPRVQGAGSSAVVPERIVSPVHALGEALPGVVIDYHRGGVLDHAAQPFRLEDIRVPGSDQCGLALRLLDAEGMVVLSETRATPHPTWLGNFPSAARQVDIAFDYIPTHDAMLTLSVHTPGTVMVTVDHHTIIDAVQTSDDDPLGASPVTGAVVESGVQVLAGRIHRINVHVEVPARLPLGIFGVYLRTREQQPDAAVLRAEAVEAARRAAVAVVAVGAADGSESEGSDRTTLSLSAEQDALVAAVAAANPRTVVVLMAGAPVVMPWRDQVNAIVLTWFGGQEIGAALADMLTGATEPGGRLPTTWPAAQRDVPVLSVTPTNGVLRYDEGIHLGYRAWLRAGTTPAYPFGWGLGYTTWSLGEASATFTAQGSLWVRVPVTNTGDRDGTELVQVYLSRPDADVDYPERWLAGFARVSASAGDTVEACVEIDSRQMSRWDVGRGEWVLDAGAVGVHVGTNVLNLADLIVDLGGPSVA